MNVIITLAGHSRRFEAAGYNTPKFLIPIDGKPMIEHVVNMFSYSDTFHFVINEKQLKDYPHLPNLFGSLVPKSTITVIEPHEIGPTFSALQVKGINQNEKIILVIAILLLSGIIVFLKERCMAMMYKIPSFKGMHPASFGDTYYAYMKLNRNNELLIKLREKQSFTKKATPRARFRWNLFFFQLEYF